MKTASHFTVGLVLVTALLSCALVLPLVAQMPAEIEERRAAIEQLSPSAKRELQRKKDSFDQLPADEQARLRRLDAEINKHPQAHELREVLERYGKWLGTLSPEQRTDLRNRSVDDRLARIQTLRQLEQDSNLTKCGLTPNDANAIYQWWDRFSNERQDLLLQIVPEQERERFEKLQEDDPRRVGALRWAVRRSLDELMEHLPPADRELLISQLSTQARDRFYSAENKSELLADWVRESIHFRMSPPPVSDGDVQRMIEKLPPDEREQLKELPRDEIVRRLRERSVWRTMRPPGPRFRFDEGRGPRGGRGGSWNDDDDDRWRRGRGDRDGRDRRRPDRRDDDGRRGEGSRERPDRSRESSDAVRPALEPGPDATKAADEIQVPEPPQET